MKDIYVLTGAIALTAILSIPLNQAFNSYTNCNAVVMEESCSKKFMDIAVPAGHYMLDHVGEVVVESALVKNACDDEEEAYNVVNYCPISGMNDNGTCNARAIVETHRNTWDKSVHCMTNPTLPKEE